MTSSQIGVLKKIDFRAMCHHIGRTSSFYLYDKDLVQRENGRINWSWTMYNIFNELGYSNYYQLLEFDNEGNVDEEESFKCNEDYYTREEWIEELKPALQYIVDDMYDDFIRKLKMLKRYMSISKIQKIIKLNISRNFLNGMKMIYNTRKTREIRKWQNEKKLFQKCPKRYMQ